MNSSCGSSFGYVVPLFLHVATLVNDSFESGPAPISVGMPCRPGVWSGDLSEVVGPSQGVTPHSGGKMLRLLRADYTGKSLHEADPFRRVSYVADQWRLIYLRPYKADLSQAMVVARKSLSDQHGAITMRRLNRREYANTLKDLLGVEINVSELPSDNGPGSFDTVGSNLFMSANQFDQYRGLGREVIEEAFARYAGVAGTEELRIEGEEFSAQMKKEEADAIDAERRAKQWIAKVEEAAAIRSR